MLGACVEGNWQQIENSKRRIYRRWLASKRNVGDIPTRMASRGHLLRMFSIAEDFSLAHLYEVWEKSFLQTFFRNLDKRTKLGSQKEDLDSCRNPVQTGWMKNIQKEDQYFF